MSESMPIDGVEPADAPAPARGKRTYTRRSAPVRRIRAEAPVRAETVREPVRAPEAARTRRRNAGGTSDKYHVPPNLIPSGSSVEWKRDTVFGQKDDAYELSLLEAGWLPVAAEQMPGMMRAGYKGPVQRDGMILYERPMELTMEARQEDAKAARTQMRAKEEQLSGAPPGTFARDEHPQTRPNIKHGYEPMEIPAD